MNDSIVTLSVRAERLSQSEPNRREVEDLLVDISAELLLLEARRVRAERAGRALDEIQAAIVALESLRRPLQGLHGHLRV